MKSLRKEQLYGVSGTIIVHLIVLIILLLAVIDKPQQQEEAGVPVIMGNIDASLGDEFAYTEVNTAPQQVSTENSSTPQPDKNEPLITQNEESVSIENADKQKAENSDAANKAKEEAERKAREEEERKRKEAEEMARIANAKVAGAFGKGSTLSAHGNTADNRGNEGTTKGNETSGATKGVGNYGTFDLNGRSLGQGGLPRPVYNVQDEGRVVVNITVNPNGLVIRANINPRTNTSNPDLRRAALEAAKKAVFNKVNTVDDQTGTITYYFKLR